MQTYLKTRPVWVQLFLFLGMAFGILMVVFMIGGLLLSKVTGIGLMEMGDSKNWDVSNPNMLMAIRGMLLLQFLGLFFIPSLLFAYFSDPKPLTYIGLRTPFKKRYWLLGIASLLVAIPLVEYTGLLNRQFPFDENTRRWMEGIEEEAARTIRFMLVKNSVKDLILNLIFIALFAGVGEELFFRGILQRLFIRGFKSPWTGIVLAAFLFSFFHFQFFGFIPRFLLGILLGAIYWYSGSLWPAILAHFAYDAFIIILAYFNPSMIENTNQSFIENSTLPLMALGSALFSGLLLWVMIRSSSGSYEAVYAEDKQPPSEKDLTF